jgi:hypothetical protein
MRFSISLILFFVSIQSFSQNKLIAKSISLISKADTVYFIADNSGCFNAYILEVKMCKQKSGNRKLILKTEKSLEEKTLSSKNYKAFIKKYETSVNHFIGIDNGKCTSTTEFDLYCKHSKDKITTVKYKNTTCEAAFNPELFLQELLRTTASAKK